MNRNATAPLYTPLKRGLKQMGYRVVPVPIMWNYKTISNYVDTFVPIYERKKGEHNTILGHSLAAMAAFVAAPMVKPDRLILASLSSYFKEDLPNYHRPFGKWKHENKRRLADYQTLSANDLAQQVNKLRIPTTLVYGAYEKKMYPELVARVKKTGKSIRRATVHELPNAEHPMATSAYTTGLLNVIKRLN